MKRFFISTVLTVSAISLVGIMSACDDDNGGGSPSLPDVPSSEVVSYNVEYDVDLSDAYYEMYDITLTYTDADGLVKSRALTADFDYEFDVPVARVADRYVFNVVGKVKSTLPEISTTSLYKFEKKGEMEVKCKTSEGRSFTKYADSMVGTSVTIRGDRVAEYVTVRHPEIVFADYGYIVK